MQYIWQGESDGLRAMGTTTVLKSILSLPDRERVMPHLLAGAFPASGLLSAFLSSTIARSSTTEGGWVLEALKVGAAMR